MEMDFIKFQRSLQHGVNVVNLFSAQPSPEILAQVCDVYMRVGLECYFLMMHYRLFKTEVPDDMPVAGFSNTFPFALENVTNEILILVEDRLHYSSPAIVNPLPSYPMYGMKA